MIRRSIAIAAAVLLPWVLVCGAAAKPARPADTPDPSGTVAITPSGGGSTRGTLHVLAGSPDTLLYALWRKGADPGAELFARDGSATTTGLGPQPDASEYSVVGQSVTAADPGGSQTVWWWDLGTRHSGTITLPTADTYLFGAPDGFVYTDGAALYEEKTADQSVTSLGTPITGASTDSGAAGADGFVVSSGTTTVYGTWSAPGQYKTLDTGGDQYSCAAVVGAYAACADVSTGSDPDAELVPVDGAAPATLHTGTLDGGIGVVGSTLIVNGETSSDKGKLYSRTYSSAAVRTSSVAYDNPYLVSALGRAVVPTPDDSRLDAVTSASSAPTTLVTAPYGGPVATNLSLSAGRVVYNDDEKNSAVPPKTSSTLRTALSTDASPLSVGATSTVKAGDVGTVSGKFPETVTTPLASGTTTAYPSAAKATDYSGAEGGVLVTESLTVTGPHRSRTITHIMLARPDSEQQWRPVLSGNRLSYLAQTGTGTPTFFVYDVAKDTTTKILVQSPSYSALPVPAVSGNYVAYVKENGSIWRRNLDTGATSEIAGKDSTETEDASVFADGDYVAWSRLVQVGLDGSEVYSGYRNAVTGAHAYLGHDIVADLSASGPVLDGTENHYSLRTFGGTTLPITQLADEHVTSGTFPLETVQVDGQTASWIDDNGVLKAAPLSISAPAPRMEGDTLAPKPAHPDQIVWHPYVPYSQPLTSCSVAVTHGSSTVATLACNKAEMATGVVDVQWNGHVGSHRAPAGTYHYAITAAGAGGSALDSDGHANPVAGHFTIN